MAIAEKLTYLLETKNAIKNAIKNKGMEVTDAESFRSYANKINSIQPGIDINGITEECKVAIGDNVNTGDFVTFLSNNGETKVKTITSPNEQIGGIAITSGQKGEMVQVKVPNV